MKKTKLLLMGLICFLSLPAFVACDDDDDYISYLIDMGTVTQDGDVWYIDGDQAGRMLPDNTALLKANGALNQDQRVIAYFNFTGSDARSQGYEPINLYDVYRVLTKDVYLMPVEGGNYTPEEIEAKQDSIGHDPIGLSKGFISEKHINLYFTMYGSNSGISHFINLVAAEDAVPENGVLTVELRHNNEGDREAFRQWGWVAFPLNSIPGYEDGTTTKLRIKTDEGDGSVRYQEIELKVNNDEEQKISTPASFSNTKIS